MRRKRFVLGLGVVLSLLGTVGIGLLCGTGLAWSATVTAPSPERLLVRAIDLVGFEPSGKAAVYSSVAAWVKHVDAGDPSAAHRDKASLPREGFVAGAYQREKGTLTDKRGAGFSAGLVFKTNAGAAADDSWAFSSSLAATRRLEPHAITRFAVPGIRQSKGFTAFGRGGMAGNVYFAVGHCEVNIGEQANPTGGASRAELQQTVQESVTGAAMAVYRRVHKQCSP
jgi:hypothetical protein